MSVFSLFRSVIVALFHRSRLETEMDEELRVHVEDRASDLERSGVSRAEAERRARLEFGGYQKFKEECREAFGAHFVETLLQDIRYGLRMLRKSPGFTTVAVLTLALGIGATTTLFSVVEAVLLKPLPYYQASRLAVLWTDNVRQDLHEERTSYPNFEDWRRLNTSLEDMAFATAFTVNLTSNDETVRLVAARSSANLFSLMGVKPILGRTFSNEEEERGEQVVILSHAFWARWFASSPGVLGKNLDLDGTQMMVVGVMPATFQFPAGNVEFWEPLTVFPHWSDLKQKRNTPSGFVVGRLKRGVSFSQAQADMNVVGAHLTQQYPALATNADFFGFGVNVVPLKIYATGKGVQDALWLLSGAALLVLFVACTNVAGLLLSRGSVRAREFATRMALGAGRKRVARQLLIEGTIVYLISAGLGIAIAATADRLLLQFAPSDIPRLQQAGIDFGVLSFALLLSFLTALVFGLVPALRVSATNLHLALRESDRHSSATSAVLRLRSLLVTSEFALAVILAVGSGLLIRSFLRVQHVDPGFKPDHVLTARVVQSTSKSEVQWGAFYEHALRNLGAIPGVEAVGAIDNFFFASFPDETVIVEGRPPLPPGTSLSQVTDDGVSPGYFRAVGVPLLRGRFFTEQDGPSSTRTAIINATMSRRFWPGQDPVGNRFKFAYQTAGDPWITVVGVVGDMHRDGLTKDPVSEIFLPLAQDPARGMDLVVRTSGDPRSLVGAVRGVLRSADKTVPMFNVSTLEDALHDQVAPRRFQTLLLSLFASLAVVLSAIGVYGLMHYWVTQRTREIGVRVALGARPFQIIRLVLREGAGVAMAGTLVGAGGALAIGRVLNSLLFRVAATDPATFGAVMLLLCLVAFAASYVPARRAMRVDPMTALRHE